MLYAMNPSDLVEAVDSTASGVRVNTPVGVKAWRVKQT